MGHTKQVWTGPGLWAVFSSSLMERKNAILRPIDKTHVTDLGSNSRSAKY